MVRLIYWTASIMGNNNTGSPVGKATFTKKWEVLKSCFNKQLLTTNRNSSYETLFLVKM